MEARLNLPPIVVIPNTYFFDVSYDSFTRVVGVTATNKRAVVTVGILSNSTVPFLPTDNRWAVAVLNAPVSWWFARRTAQYGKDEALRYFTDQLNEFPIPKPTERQIVDVEAAVGKLVNVRWRE